MEKIVYKIEVDLDYDKELTLLVDQFREEGIKTTKEELLYKFSRVGNLSEIKNR